MNTTVNLSDYADINVKLRCKATGLVNEGYWDSKAESSYAFYCNGQRCIVTGPVSWIDPRLTVGTVVFDNDFGISVIKTHDTNSLSLESITGRIFCLGYSYHKVFIVKPKMKFVPEVKPKKKVPLPKIRISYNPSLNVAKPNLFSLNDLSVGDTVYHEGELYIVTRDEDDADLKFLVNLNNGKPSYPPPTEKVLQKANVKIQREIC